MKFGSKLKPLIILCVLSVLLNVLLVWFTKLVNIPVYLDSAGTIIAASLGGYLPGIIVGFLSNCITSLLSVTPDPMTLYYSFISILLAIAAAYISKHGLFIKWYGKVISIFVFAFIGGALGSLLTWVLYGLSFGEGISAPLASFFFNNLGMSEFMAQMTADIGIDLIDKSFTVAISCAVLYLLPDRYKNRFTLGRVYLSCNDTTVEKGDDDIKHLRQQMSCRRRSIRTKITALILVSTTVLSVVAITIGGIAYYDKMALQYKKTCEYVVKMMTSKIGENEIDSFIKDGTVAVGYSETKKSLKDIYDNAKDIKRMYVYEVKREGFKTVFYINGNEADVAQIGDIVPFDEAFPYTAETLAGKTDIPSFTTEDDNGRLLTVYKPIKNETGAVVAYAGADINMAGIKTDLYAFIISICSLLFGVMILIIMFSIIYCNRRILIPVTILAEQANNLDFDGTKKGQRVRDRYTVKTGDELEEVFQAMCLTEDTIAKHIEENNRKNLEISRMQRNIIYTLANMVENRDSNTGGHVRRTASYVKLIGKNLKLMGVYKEVINDAYIKDLYDSAPLHDIGKIKIPDAILNKPGRLTTEEFDIMKTHTSEGRTILSTSLDQIEDGSWLSMAVEMATYHHEKWDGSGYPEGLSGENIPLSARIMAVSDVFDALVSQRSYKEPFTFEAAMQIIRDGAGSHFDPKIVEAFVLSEDKIKEIMQS